MRISILGLLFGFFLVGHAASQDDAFVPRIRALVEELGSPSLGGRAAGSVGLENARDRIAAELRAIGLEPAFADGSFLQEFPYFAGQKLGSKNSLAETTAGAAGAGDFFPLSVSKSGSLENAKLVFVGYGIQARDERGRMVYDDYAGMDVKGKVVIAFLGDPAIQAEKSIFRDPAQRRHAEAIQKTRLAAEKGAGAILFVRGPLELDGEAEIPLRFDERAGGGAAFDILAGRVSAAYAERLVGRGKLAEWQAKIAKSQAPASRALPGKIQLTVDLSREVGRLSNVAGILRGQDSKLAGETIVVGAHYDHLGQGGENSRETGDASRVHPGADDNASGVAGALSLARRMKAWGKNRRSVVFVFFAGEEIGLLGSRHFVENPGFGKDAKDYRVVAMLNFDMIGRLGTNNVVAVAAKTGNEFPAILSNAGRASKTSAVFGSVVGGSDHEAFLEKKIPAIHFTTGAHDDYHRATDTADKVDFAGIDKIAGLAYAALTRMDQFERPPSFDAKAAEAAVGRAARKDAKGGRNYGAYFGSVPDFAETNTGVLIKGVKPGSPAEKVGLKEKDTLVGLGDVGIRNLYDFVYALRSYRAGEKVAVRWVREGQPMEAEAKLETSKE